MPYCTLATIITSAKKSVVKWCKLAKKIDGSPTQRTLGGAAVGDGQNSKGNSIKKKEMSTKIPSMMKPKVLLALSLASFSGE